MPWLCTERSRRPARLESVYNWPRGVCVLACVGPRSAAGGSGLRVSADPSHSAPCCLRDS